MTVYIVFYEYTPFKQRFSSVWSTREAALRHAYRSFATPSNHDYAIVQKVEVDQPGAFEITDAISASDAQKKQEEGAHG